MRLLILLLLFSAFAKTGIAQLPDTLERGDNLVILNQDSLFEIWSGGELINQSKDSAELINQLRYNFIESVGLEGKAIADARDYGRRANQFRWLVNQLDTINVQEYARQVYQSKLQGVYVLRSGRDRVRLDFNENFVARVGKDRYRMIVSSITNLSLTGVEENPVQFTSNDTRGIVITWTGFDAKGNTIILRKVR